MARKLRAHLMGATMLPDKPSKKKKRRGGKKIVKSVYSDFDDEERLLLNKLEATSFSDNSTSDGLPDPRKLIERAISNDLDTSVFKEEQFEEAKNVIDWCRNPKFLGTKMDLFSRQFQVLTHFFCDICYQCSDVEFIHDVPVDASVGECLDRFALLDRGVCPQCKRNRTETLQEWQRDYRFREFNPHLEDSALSSLRPVPPNEFVGVWGQRSGKSLTVSSFSSSYVLHRYLCIPSLSRYFDQAENAIFDTVFAAPTLNQVKKNLWLPFRNVYFDSPWFREVREHTIAEGKRVGTQLYKAEETYITFINKRIAIHMLAANSSTLRGGSRFCCALDELGWFRSGNNQIAGVRDGKEVFQALNNSLLTFRTQADVYRRGKLGDYDCVDGYMFNISSPSAIADPIMERAEQASKKFRVYYTHYPTWLVNPNEREDLICEEFAGEPEKLKRDFYAIPPRAASPFIEDDSILKQLIYQEDVRLYDTKITTFTDQGGYDYYRPEPVSIKADPHTPRVLTVDIGETKNSFSLMLGRYYPEHQGVLYEEPVEVAPQNGRRVDLAWCYDYLVLPLIKSFNVLYVGYDRWNSAQAIHDLRTNHNINAIRYSLKWKDFSDFREDLYGSKLWFSKPETTIKKVLSTSNIAMRARWPRAHLLTQMVTVNQFGKKVYKPDQGNDDLFRCAVLCHRIIKANIKEFASKTKAVNYSTHPEAIGFFSSRSGTKSTAGSGTKSSRRRGGGRRRPGVTTGDFYKTPFMG